MFRQPSRHKNCHIRRVRNHSPSPEGVDREEEKKQAPVDVPVATAAVTNEKKEEE